MEAHPELFFDYESSAALVRAYQEIAIKAGFCVRILHSEPGRPRLRLCCDRNGTSNSTRKQTLTKRVGCPYEILVRKHAISGKWRFVRRTGEHNHPFMAGARFHRMTHAQREHRAQLHRDGMKIVNQVAFMRATYPTLLISYRDIVNEEARLKQLAEKQKQQQQHSFAEELEDGPDDGGNGDDGNADRGDSNLEDDALDPSENEETEIAMPSTPMPPQQQQRQQHPQGRHPSFTTSVAAATQHRHLSERISPTPTFQPPLRQQAHRPPVQPPPPPPPPRTPRSLAPSPLQQVLETLQAFSKSTGASDYVFTYKVEREPGGPPTIDRITHLFVAHRKSLELAREFHDVLSIELAKPKKLNKGMMLLLCTAKTPFKVPFLCAGVFIDTLRRREIFKPDYKWALDAIEGALCMESKGGYCVGDAVSVLIADTSDPKLLDAQKKTFPNASLIVSGTRTRKAFSYSWRQFFPQDQAVWDDMIQRWDAMCDAPTKDEFERHWEEFRAKKEFGRVPGFLTYVEEKVLVNKEMFMEAWVNDRLHLGCVNTPLTDGPSHVFKKNPDSILKKFRPRYGVDLAKLWKEFDADIERQYWDVKRCHTDEESFRLVECDDHLYSKVTYRIVSRALLLVHECITATQAWSQGREFTLQYSDKYFVSMGLPSFDVIRDRVVQNEPFELTDFHRFWLVERVDGSNELPRDLPPPVPSAGMPSAVPLSPFDEAILRLRERFFTVTPLMQAEILAQVNRITSTSAPSYPVPAAHVPLMGPRKRVRPSTATKISRGKVRQCSLCSQTGHNSRGCPVRDVFEEFQEPVPVQPAAQLAAIAVVPPTIAASAGKRARTSTGSAAQQGKLKQCSQCKQMGHNSRGCRGFFAYEGIQEEQ